MGFHTEDFYVAGGDNKILHSWTPGVEKFDTSSFYNWEQDNIPLYDLEERTYYLWEKAGWPTSSAPQVSGVIFSVSADAIGTDTYADDSNIFLSLSSAIAALPDIIRYPVRIEVANYGDLGELTLNNLHFTASGALEIVNRNFAPILPGNYDQYHPSAGPNTSVTGTAAGYTTGDTTPFMGSLSSADVINTLTDTSAIGIANVASASTGGEITDTRYNNNNIIFAQLVHGKEIGSNQEVKTARMTMGLNTADAFPGSNVITLNPYGDTQDKSVSSYDFSGTTNQITGDLITRKDLTTTNPTATAFPAVGAFYGNFLQKLEVNNCTGKIYIRNFAVDGAWGVTTPTAHITDVGIRVNNSEVVLEHCAAMRCLQAGFEFNNSDVILNRGAIAYRNYGLSSNTNGDHLRISDPDAAGFRFYNSNIQLSTCEINGYGSSGAGALFASTRNGTNGILMHNSILTGGTQRLAAGYSNSMTSLQVFENQTRGIKLTGSRIDLNGAMDVWLHDTGIEAFNSEIVIDELYVDCHKTLGVRLANSVLEYAKNKVEKTVPVAVNDSSPELPFGTASNFYYWADYPGMVNFDSNGQHLTLENSQMYHPRLTAGAGLSRNKFKRNHGTSLAQTSARKLSIPAIVCNNNSDLNLTFARIETQSGDDFAAGGGTPTSLTGSRGGTANGNYGSCLLIKNNSTCRVVGGNQKYTLFDGPVDYLDQKYNAGVYVTDNSRFIVNGPSLFIRFGVDALVDNNSVMDITPPKDDYGFVDEAQWGLSGTAQNQTKVDLHSTRACLVAQNNSVINMQDCGDFNGQWSQGAADEAVGIAGDWYASALVLSANYDTYEASACQAQGSIQFYPNPQLQTGLATYNPTAYARAMSDNQSFPLKSGGDGATPNDVTALSFGGMCVRGLNGSRVNVRNVNFPAGWNNTSSLYYDYADASIDPNGCNQLRIWNIDETSELDMSFASVSSHFPPLVGYNGPSAVYTRGDDNAGVSAQDAPPVNKYGIINPTSSISILDSFGPAAGPYFEKAPQNFGAFRLYVAPVQYAKYLVYKGGALTQRGGPYYAPAASHIETSIIYQTIAQGYNMSGACSSVLLDGSSGPDLYSVYGAGTTVPSGVQGDVSVSSLHASAMFLSTGWGMAKDARLYTSAVGLKGGSNATYINNTHAPGRKAGYSTATFPEGDIGRASQKPDGFPGYMEQWTGDNVYPATKPLFQHYKLADFFYTEDLVGKGYDARITLDESAIAVFANAKNATLGNSGRPKLVTMKTSTTSYAGEGAQSEAATAGKGFLSASEFDLDKQD